MPHDIERRTIPLDRIQLEERADNTPRIVGHAALFDSLSENLGGFREIIKPGAFARSIQEDDIRALFNHNPDVILGRNRADTLRLAEDDQGLAIEIDPPDTQAARDLMTSMRRGDINQMSFGFRVRAGGSSWDEDENGDVVRTLTDVALFDVSPVVYPAYPETDVGVRALRDWRMARDAEAQERIANELERRARELALAEL